MEYELVHEIKNSCPNNQMRDVFFEEVVCDSPEAYVRSSLRCKALEMTVEPQAGGTVTIHATADGLIHKFLFTPI